MASEFALRTWETATVTGTAAYNLEGAVDNSFRAYVSGFANGASVVFVAANAAQGFELVRGTLVYGTPNVLQRTTIIDSSNGGAAVVWDADTVVQLQCVADLVLVQKAEALPLIAAGDVGKMMQVNAAETAFEMVNWRAKLHSHVYGGV